MATKRTDATTDSYFYLSLLVGGALNYFILPYYIAGDQVHYRDLYTNLAVYPLGEAFGYYTRRINSKEPVYFFITWLCAYASLPKDLVMLIANITLISVGFRTLVKLGAHPAVAFFVVCVNFYSFVLYFAAERLKFAVLFFLFFCLCAKYRIAFALTSLLCHAQMMIPFTSYLGYLTKNNLTAVCVNLSKGVHRKLILIGLPLVVLITIAILKDHVLAKFRAYAGEGSIRDLLKLLSFFALSLLYNRGGLSVVIVFLPLLIAALLFGGERINFNGYFAFLYFSLQCNRGLNIGVIATGVYFALQGIAFLHRVVTYGNGFFQP